MEEFKHTCGYGIVDIQPDCDCYEEYKKRKTISEQLEEFKKNDLENKKDTIEALEKLLNEIDALLTRFEDFTHKKDGEDITKMRGKIALALRQYNTNGQICSHTQKEYVAGVFGGVYCKDCKEKLE